MKSLGRVSCHLLAFFANQLSGSAHLIVDVTGYFTDCAGAVLAYHDLSLMESSIPQGLSQRPVAWRQNDKRRVEDEIEAVKMPPSAPESNLLEPKTKLDRSEMKSGG